MQRKLKTLTHIVNRLKEACIIKYELKIYEKGDQLIIDVMPSLFLGTIKHLSAIRQISGQLLLPMYSKRGRSFEGFNYFDWNVISDGNKEGSRCFIRFIIFPERFIPFTYCNVCGRRVKRPYGGPPFNNTKKNCPKCGLVLTENCTATYKNYKRLPKNQRGIEFER